MNPDKLKDHIRLCRRNLKSGRVKCCAQCPFEDEIAGAYPELRVLFNRKREYIIQGKDVTQDHILTSSPP